MIFGLALNGIFSSFFFLCVFEKSKSKVYIYVEEMMDIFW